jgi:hypothetical protein
LLFCPSKYFPIKNSLPTIFLSNFYGSPQICFILFIESCGIELFGFMYTNYNYDSNISIKTKRKVKKINKNKYIEISVITLIKFIKNGQYRFWKNIYFLLSKPILVIEESVFNLLEFTYRLFPY